MESLATLAAASVTLGVRSYLLELAFDLMLLLANHMEEQGAA